MFRLLLAASLLGAASGALHAQTPTPPFDFTNFEIPENKGVEVVTLGGQTWIAVCHPDDNSVRLVDATTQTEIQRIETGLGPVSVFFDDDPNQPALYTADWLGDSVTAIDLDPASTPPATVRTIQSLQTKSGLPLDAPVDVLVRGGTDDLLVLLSTTGELAAFDKGDLTPSPAFVLGTFDRVPLLNGAAIPQAMKHPWRLVETPNGEVTVLNQFGGSNAAAPSNGAQAVDFDMLRWDLNAALLTSEGDLGTTNHGLAIASDGSVFVVGSRARNDLLGENQLTNPSAAPTGFVESHLWRLPSTLGTAGILDRDLNADTSGTPSPEPVAVSMPSDVALLESGATIQNAFVTSFHNDRIVILDATASGATQSPATWPLSAVQLTPRTGYAMAGPRSLEVVTVNATNYLYVHCKLDASLRVFTIGSGGALTSVATLAFTDPMPLTWRSGQALLYDARFSDSSRVSCASCHFDGRTDRLLWTLDPGAGLANPVIAAHLKDGIVNQDPNLMLPNSTFPSDRGPMTTQTLQGLRTHRAESYGADIHPVLSTRPFYWRGARSTFLAFGVAFADLLGGTEPSQSEMEAFRDFVFTINYPPNPEQPLDRTYPGVLGDPDLLADGSGMLRGLKLYHTMPNEDQTNQNPTPLPGNRNTPVTSGPFCVGRSCVQCHALGSGTSGTLTLSEGPQPIKSAQLRGLRNREHEYRALFDVSGAVPAPLAAMPHGLFHDGDVGSSNSLIDLFFNPEQITPGHPVDVTDLIAFVRAFDHGIAPMVGKAISLRATNQDQWSPDLASVVLAMQTQTDRAHAGLVVLRRVGGATTHYYYDASLGLYVELGPGATAQLPLQGAGGIVPDLATNPLTGSDLIAFRAVPIGDERRIGHPSGVLDRANNGAPSNLTVKLVAADPWKPLETTPLTANLLGSGFHWGAPTGTALPKSVTAMQTFHAELAGQFGVSTNERHEPPRRFQVTGDGILPGAQLAVFMPQWDAGGAFVEHVPVTFPLHPVRLDPATVVWETDAALSPKTQFILQCGGPTAPGVQETLDTGTSTALNAVAHNLYVFAVANETTTGIAPFATTNGALSR